MIVDSSLPVSLPWVRQHANILPSMIAVTLIKCANRDRINCLSNKLRAQRQLVGRMTGIRTLQTRWDYTLTFHAFSLVRQEWVRRHCINTPLLLALTRRIIGVWLLINRRFRHKSTIPMGDGASSSPERR